MKNKTAVLEKFNAPEFVAGLRAGEEAAFRELAVELYPWFVHFVHKKFNIPIEDAKDIAQDTMFNIYQKILAFNPDKGRFLNWAFQILRNRSLDRLRAQSRLAITSLEKITADKIVFEERIAASTDDLSPLEKLPREVRQAILQLPGRYQQLIGLLLLGIKGSQIMEIMQIKTANNLRSLKSRMMAKLRIAIQNQPENERYA